MAERSCQHCGGYFDSIDIEKNCCPLCGCSLLSPVEQRDLRISQLEASVEQQKVLLTAYRKEHTEGVAEVSRLREMTDKPIRSAYQIVARYSHGAALPPDLGDVLALLGEGHFQSVGDGGLASA